MAPDADAFLILLGVRTPFPNQPWTDRDRCLDRRGVSPPPKLGRFLPAFCAVFTMVGCRGPQSALDPAGTDAAIIADLFWGMAIAGFVIWLAMTGLTLHASSPKRARAASPRWRRNLVVGGTGVTTLLLAVLVTLGLRPFPQLLARGDPDAVKLRIVGEQWWWRVEYILPSGERLAAANEIRLPAGRRTHLDLEAADVIHSFWVPSLAGKIDMIPGQTTSLGLEPTRTGSFRGVCAEYCGSSHAQMLFRAVVVEPDAFEAWLQHEAAPARSPEPGSLAEQGRQRFVELGCTACHTIRGTVAHGVIGPDLTHVGSRETVGAGLLDNDVAGFEEWLAETERLKPGVHMPAFAMLAPEARHALSIYLDSLQ